MRLLTNILNLDFSLTNLAQFWMASRKRLSLANSLTSQSVTNKGLPSAKQFSNWDLISYFNTNISKFFSILFFINIYFYIFILPCTLYNIAHSGDVAPAFQVPSSLLGILFNFVLVSHISYCILWTVIKGYNLYFNY